MKKLLFIFLLSICTSVYAQESTSFFDDYHKLSLQFGVSRYVGSERTSLPATLDYKLKDYTSPHFGFYYDVLQTNHFNLKLGLSTLLVRDFREFRMDSSEIPNVNRDVHLYIEGGGTWRINLPFTGEYLLKTKIGTLSLNGSFIIGYSEEFGDLTTQHSIRANSEPEFTTTDAVYGRRTAPWYANGQIGFGMYFPFKGWMLRTNVYYNRAFQKLYEGEFEFKNLAQSPDTSGEFSFRGDSFGIEFSIYLAKKKKKSL